jgi:hypothetical protein
MADVIAPNDSATHQEVSVAAAREAVKIKISPTASPYGAVEAILEVAKQRKTLLDQLRATLESGNDTAALRFARQLCGLPGSGCNEKGY